MKSKKESDFTNKMVEMLEQLAENRTDIKAVKKDTERIIDRLDGINGRVGHCEKELSFMKGFNSVLFAAFGIIIALITVFK